MDCGKDFEGDAYKSHTSCISEAQKYQGSLFQGVRNSVSKGAAKQERWVENLLKLGAESKNPRLSGYMSQLAGYTNIPRKEKKFINFAKNSLNVHDTSVLAEIWAVFEKAKNAPEVEPEPPVEDNPKPIAVAPPFSAEKKSPATGI
eukprot:UC1_evm1s1873